MNATLRWPSITASAPSRKPVARGASRMVAKELLAARPKADFSGFKRLLWPLLFLVLGLAAYTLAERALPLR